MTSLGPLLRQEKGSLEFDVFQRADLMMPKDENLGLNFRTRTVKDRISETGKAKRGCDGFPVDVGKSNSGCAELRFKRTQVRYV